MHPGGTRNAAEVSRAMWPVMVLAHNEARHITACLDSLYAAERGREFEIFVLANGCTDNTEELVEAYAKKQPGVHLVSIQMADKCNAWNVYIHDVIPRRVAGRDVYFFMDGDARACPGALSELTRALDADRHAQAAAAVPFSGRSMERERAELLEQRGLVANLYALTGKFVMHLQQTRVRLPLGLEGDDGLIGALVKWNLDPRQQWDNRRIVPCANAGFIFESMSWRRWKDWKAYWRRKIRYARRRYEFELLGPRLKGGGIEALPVSITELYRYSTACKLRWSGIDTLFYWLALRQLRRRA